MQMSAMANASDSEWQRWRMAATSNGNDGEWRRMAANGSGGKWQQRQMAAAAAVINPAAILLWRHLMAPLSLYSGGQVKVSDRTK